MNVAASLPHSSTYAKLPEHLKAYVVAQHYEKYTPRDHAVWRYIMRNAREYFRSHAHPVYLAGLEKTGIPISHIPKITDMDAVLNRFGWGAVCVCGFIPPLAFLEFQAHNVLPIAADMRTLEHLAYTPAPDIVHEAAGHAPILADELYAQYLRRYAQVARKAIFADEDITLYEAIRLLSDVKENPDSTTEACEAAEQNLKKAVAGLTWASEATKVARLYWWTVEYGLVGSLSEPQIYGAGLLSSLSEGRDCLGASVRKLPLSLDCVAQSYDITRPQPQLYVARDFGHLLEVLAALEEQLAFKRGGLSSLLLAQKAKAVTTTVLDSGLQISGVLAAIENEPGSEQVQFLRWQGPVQLAFAEQQLAEHGCDRHSQGFSTPLGSWAGAQGRDPVTFTDAELASCGLVLGQEAQLHFLSGFEVRGIIKGFLRQKGKLLLITWSECTVSKAGATYFLPAWGEFDLAVGSSIPSVFGGPADLQRFGVYHFGKPTSVPGRVSPYTAAELRLFDLYERVRALREKRSSAAKFLAAELAALEVVQKQLRAEFAEEWLLALEVYELLCQLPRAQRPSWAGQWQQEFLDPQCHRDPQVQKFVTQGLRLAALAD